MFSNQRGIDVERYIHSLLSKRDVAGSGGNYIDFNRKVSKCGESRFKFEYSFEYIHHLRGGIRRERERGKIRKEKKGG